MGMTAPARTLLATLLLLFLSSVSYAEQRVALVIGNGAYAPLSVPDLSYGVSFRAAAPLGRGRLMAIVTEDYVDLDGLLEGHRDFELIEDRLEFVSSIAERLYRVWTGDDDRNRSARWTVGYTDYEIHE